MSKEAPRFKNQAPEKLQIPKLQFESPSNLLKLPVVLVLVSGFLVAGCATKGPQQSKAATPVVSSPVPAKSTTNAYETMIQKAAAEPMAAVEGTGWKPMFDGRTLAGWQQTDFSGHGQVYCQSGLMVLDRGDSLTGINWTNDMPKVDYEVVLDAMKLQGSDFFCGLTFPVQDTYCSLILGGWGGTVVGLSSIESEDASENETTRFIKFETGQWYRVRLRVTATKIEAWLDDKQIIELKTEGLHIALRFGEIEMSKPLGIASYETATALRGIKMRRLEANDLVPKPRAKESNNSKKPESSVRKASLEYKTSFDAEIMQVVKDFYTSKNLPMQEGFVIKQRNTNCWIISKDLSASLNIWFKINPVTKHIIEAGGD